MKNLKIIETVKVVNKIFFYHKKCTALTDSMLRKSRINNMINIHIKEVIKQQFKKLMTCEKRAQMLF